MIITALFMSIINIQNVLITLSHCIIQLTVVHLYVVEIIIVLLIDRSNAQTEFLKEFIFRNNFDVSWDHSLSKKDFTYVNMS